jgi:hypothetical protein
MPWHIEQNHPGCPSSRPWAVVLDSTGEVVGCHETEASAEAQLAALYASEGENFMNDILYYPARVVRARSPLLDLFPPDEALLARYRERFPDSEANPFFLKTEISNNSLDHYFTHMLTTTLQNFANDAEAGVSVQDSHSTFKLGYGRSLFGQYHSQSGSPPGWDRAPRRNRGNGEPALAIPPPAIYERTLSAAHIIPGIRFGNLTYASTDDFIQAALGGSVDEVSVGFGGGSEFCDICGASYWSWDCPHVAGFAYEIERQTGPVNLLATVSIRDAHLYEYSAVYAGATPNAVVIRKARQEAESGRLTPKQADIIEQRYRVKLPVQRNWAGFSNNAANSGPDSTERSEAMDENTLSKILDLCRSAGAPADREIVEAVEYLAAEIERLRPLADAGRQYRADLIGEALAEGVRAMGDKFPAETYRGMLEAASIENIKSLRDNLAALAARQLPGGRQTVDDEQSPADRPPARDVPDSAYAV